MFFLKCSSGKIFSLVCAIFYKSNYMCSFDIIEKQILLPAYTSHSSAYTFASCMKEGTNGTQVNVGCQVQNNHLLTNKINNRMLELKIIQVS